MVYTWIRINNECYKVRVTDYITNSNGYKEPSNGIIVDTGKEISLLEPTYTALKVSRVTVMNNINYGRDLGSVGTEFLNICI